MNAKRTMTLVAAAIAALLVALPADAARGGGGGGGGGGRGGGGHGGGGWHGGGHGGGGHGSGGWHGGGHGAHGGHGWNGGGHGYWRGGWYGHRYYGRNAFFTGVFLGGAATWPWWWYPATYGPVIYDDPIFVPAATTVDLSYPAAVPAGEYWWYYCRDSQTYYPYVQQCASEWQRVKPTP